MKDFIEKSGLTASQFAKKYDIPYNTVRQWAEGKRKAPAWLARLFEAEQAYKPLINNLLNEEESYSLIYEYYNSKGLKYRAFLPKEATEEQLEWLKKIEGIYKDENKDLIERRTYKAYLHHVDKK